MLFKICIFQQLSNRLGERYSRNNCRPVSILSNVSKIFEKYMFCQMSDYMEKNYQNISVVLENDTTQNYLLY